MKILQFFKANFAALTLCLVSSVLFTSCGGGGGGGSDGTPETTRPKTMDGLTIAFQGVSFTFTRNTGTAAALTSGDVETGSFTYTLTGNNRQQFPNLNGDTSDVSFPDSLTSRNYTYTAINDASGVLVLNGIAVNDLTFTGSFNASNLSYAFYFHSDSLITSELAAPTHQSIRMDVTFTNNGSSTISLAGLTLDIPGSVLPQFDTTYPGASAIDLGGAPVPFNYNPVIDPLRPSTIVPASLNGLVFVNDSGVALMDNTVQLTAGVTAPGSSIDEMGTGLQRVNGVVTFIGVQYTWTRVPGTDTATLVLSGGTAALNGTYLYTFTSASGGTYLGDGGGVAANIPAQTGTFEVR